MVNVSNSPLVSIIVFGKKTNKLNDNELKILDGQLYKNIETIIVDGNASFLDLLTNIEQAKGQYVAFWSIENLFSCDYLRALICAAVDSKVDLVISDICKITDGKYFYYNLDPIRNLNYSDIGLTNFEIFKKYHLMTESIYLPWNKVVKKDIIKNIICSFVDFANKNNHTVNELKFGSYSPLLLNALIMKCATSYKFIPYIYAHIREKKKTNEDKRGLLQSYIRCVSVLCSLVGESACANTIKQYAGRLFLNENDIVNSSNYDDYKTYFGDKKEGLSAEDNYFNSLSTRLPAMYFTGERLKQAIASEGCTIVSFDVFDTLIVRPFSKPDDLFYLLSEKFNCLIGSQSIVDFVYMRKYAERDAREKARKLGNEEITLDEIYLAFSKNFNVSSTICEQMKALEIEFELDFCEVKHSGYELYKLAKYFEKKIIIVSDMYLPQGVVEKILVNNGFNDFDKLYVSNEYQKCKNSGKLYEYIADDLKLNKERYKTVVHIGDNYESDFKKAKEAGLTAFHTNSTMSLFKGGNSAVYCGNSFVNIYQRNTFFSAGKWNVDHYWGLRSFHGLVANKIFDNPFFAINSESDFNADPKFVGYYCVGGLLLGLTRWILNDLKNKPDCTIHFVARDGWLLKQFYDRYTKDLPSAPKSNYLYVSRKSLFVADISGKNDLLAILNNKLVVANNSPRKVITLLKPLLSASGYARIIKYYQSRGNLDTVFGSNAAYLDFIRTFTDKFYKLLDFTSYRSKLSKYFSSIIKPGDVIFDVGYSGRTEGILSSLLDFPIDSYYIHSNGEILALRENRYGFNTKIFYPWRPNITGVVREHLLMEYSASVQGYEFDDGKCKNLFGEFDATVQNSWFTKVIQNSAMQFCTDFVNIFGKYLNIFAADNYDLALPCEYYIQLAKPFDRKIFAALCFEDDVGSGGSVNVCDFWDNKYNNLVNGLLALDNKNIVKGSSTPSVQTTTVDVMKTLLSALTLPKFPALKYKRERKNKILLYSNELSWSGAPRSLLRIAKVLLKNNYKVEVWSLYDGSLKDEYVKLGIPVKIYNHENADYSYALNNFDLCIVNAAVSYKFYYVINHFLPTIWYIREATNLVDIARGNPGLSETLQNSIDMVCVSEYAKEYIANTYNKNVIVVPNCVEDKYDGTLKEFNRNKVVFTTLGTIEPRKGYDIVVEAVKLLPPEYADRIEFRIGGRVLDFCKDWAAKVLAEVKKTDNIKYLGEITQEDKLNEVYNETDVVVVASRDESCSLVALEGAMHAKPLIVTENTGAKYIVSDKNGVVIKTASAEALSKALQRFLDMTSGEITAMGNVSRQRYEECASMQYYEKCICDLIEEKLLCPNVKLIPPATDKPIVPVILATNQNYAPYVSVTIQSLLDNANPDFYYDIYVFYTELGYQTITDLNAESDNYRVKAVNITGILNNSLKLRTCAHYSIETYYRFFAPELLPFYDKLIYLDCDLIVLDDISKLYSIDIGNCVLGAVHNYMNNFVSNYVSNLGVKAENYFNAGLLIINTKKFMQANVRERSFKLLDKHEDFIMLDQDALNIICKDDIYYISEEWNVQWHHFESGCDIVINKQACLDAYASPKVLHFTGKNKPWLDARWPKANLFWSYAEKTKVFYEIVKKMSQAKSVTVLNNVPTVSKSVVKGANKKGIIFLARRFFEVWESEGFNKAVKKIINKIKINRG